MADSAWHYWWDAYPRVVTTADGTLALHIMVGTFRDDGQHTEPAAVTVEADVAGRAVTCTSPREITADDIASYVNMDTAAILSWPVLQTPDPDVPPPPLHARPYSWISRQWLKAANDSKPSNQYFEATVPDIDPNTPVRYRITVDFPGNPVVLGWFRVLVAAPVFTSYDVVGGRFGSFTDNGPTWIGHIQRSCGTTHVRVDLDDIGDGTCPVRIRIGGTWFDADPRVVASTPTAAKDNPVTLPLVDPFAGTVTVTADDPNNDEVVFEVFGRRVSATAAGGPGRARLLIAHFCIQGFNDLFERPSLYHPPRTYMQVTMRDQCGLNPSRPDSGADQEPDGYVYGLGAHRRFGVPYHLALNAGVLTLMAHDNPKDLAGLRQDIGSHLLYPALAGYGSYRTPYYQEETNRLELTACATLQKNLLGTTTDLFCPDSRVYKRDTPTNCWLNAMPVTYMVLDSRTGYYDNDDTIRPSAPKVDLGPQMLWQDRSTKKYLLFIDDDLKDSLLGGCGPRSWQTGPYGAAPFHASRLGPGAARLQPDHTQR